MTITETKSISLSTLHEKYSKIELDPSFQVPGARWEEKRQSTYFGDILNGCGNLSKITIGDLSRLRGSNDVNSESYKYYDDKMKQGFDWLSIDGNNRTVAIVKVLNDEVPVPKGEYVLNNQTFTLKSNSLFSDLDKEFKTQILALTIEVSFLVIGDMSTPRNAFIKINDGISLNEWEKNNAIQCKVSEELRNCRDKYRVSLNTIGGNSPSFFNRRKADETVFRLWYMYVHNGEQAWLPKLRKEEYDDNSTMTVHSLAGLRCVDWVCELIRVGGDRTLRANGTNVSASALGDLAMLYRYLVDENYFLSDLSDFINWWCNRQNRRYKDTQTTWDFKSDTRDYANTCRANSVDHFRVRRECLIQDFEETYRNEENVIPRHKRRAFSPSLRYIKWEEQNGICPLTNKEIPQTEIGNGSLWHLDHIIAHANGGKTIPENCQLVCADANRKKSNK